MRAVLSCNGCYEESVMERVRGIVAIDILVFSRVICGCGNKGSHIESVLEH